MGYYMGATLLLISLFLNPFCIDNIFPAISLLVKLIVMQLLAVFENIPLYSLVLESLDSFFI